MVTRDRCCVCFDHFTGVKVIALAFLLKDFGLVLTSTLGAGAGHAAFTPAVVVVTVAVSVIFAASSLMLYVGVVERSPAHFLPWLCANGVRILLTLSLILYAVFHGYTYAMSFFIGCECYILPELSEMGAVCGFPVW